MLKGYLLSVEVETGCLLVTIEWVTKDRGIQAISVCAVYTELVCAACLWVKGKAEIMVSVALLMAFVSFEWFFT